MPETMAPMEIRGNLTWTDLQRFYYFLMLHDRWMEALLAIFAFVTLTVLAFVNEWGIAAEFLSGLIAFQYVVVRLGTGQSVKERNDECEVR